MKKLKPKKKQDSFFFDILKAYAQVIILVSALMALVMYGQTANASVLPQTHTYIMPAVLTGSNTGDLENLLRTLKSNDTLNIEFAGFGGSAFQMLKVAGLIETTNAKVICRVVGPVYSAHAVLPLTCPKIAISKHAFFMFHSVQGNYDKKQIDLYNNMLLGIAGGVLTKSEIFSILQDSNASVYISGAEMLKRLN